jgi:hypothetical protein
MYLEKDSVFETATNIIPNNRMHADSNKRRSFLALFFLPVMRSVRQLGLNNSSPVVNDNLSKYANERI